MSNLTPGTSTTIFLIWNLMHQSRVTKLDEALALIKKGIYVLLIVQHEIHLIMLNNPELKLHLKQLKETIYIWVAYLKL